MAKSDIQKLIAGFRKFRDKYFANEHPLYHRLTTGVGQTPKTLIIACSDSRVDPAIILSAAPGDLFVVRNVANLVPPYQEGGGFHGVSSAIEFAVVNLAVENIIVLGHRQCGGIRALMSSQDSKPNGFVEQWVRIAQDARIRVLSKFAGESEENLCRHAELESMISSVNNLKTFPFVESAIKSRGMIVMAMYFDLELGQLQEYDESLGQFKNIEL